MVKFIIPKAKLDKIMNINNLFILDQSSTKLNLTVGTYRRNGLPFVFNCVNHAKQLILDTHHEYLPMEGNQEFLKKSKQLFLGEQSEYEAIQTLSGTGALKLCATVLKMCHGHDSIYVPSPTWGNHHNIFANSNLSVYEYGYLNGNKAFDFQYVFNEIVLIPNDNVILLQGCAHNPTGYDFTKSQWRTIVELCSAKNLIVIIDVAYLGFASGDVEQDRTAINAFKDYPHPIFICTSFSKNFGLYGERIGNLFFKCEQSTALKQYALSIVRGSYSNPPCNGAKIITTILSDKILSSMWADELTDVHTHLVCIRTSLRAKLEKATGQDFDDITRQQGMFYYSKLTPQQIAVFYENHIYFPDNGRISIGGLNDENMDQFVSVWVDAIQITNK